MRRETSIPTQIMLGTVALALIALSATPAAAAGVDRGEPVTFTKHVEPILQDHCQDCHRPLGLNLGGMVAPMPFTTYAETRPWAKSIARNVRDREMPPWHAATEQKGVFGNERTMSEAEIDTIVRWASTGAAMGDPADAPAPLSWPEGEWTFGEPDLIVEMPEPYFVADEVEDIYVDVDVEITEEMLPEPRWIRMGQAKGGSPVVHHIIARPLGGLAPGSDPAEYPKGYGALLEPGTTVTFQMHYHKEAGPGTGVWDQSQVAVWFHDEPVTHPITTTAMGNFRFQIPPGADDYEVTAERVVEEEIELISLLPHMHLRGAYARYDAYYPDGSHEVLLEVPEYDFNWQTRYHYDELKTLPVGTRLEFTARYDNSEANGQRVGFDWTRAVGYGEPTTDEMMFGFYTFAPKNPLPVEMPSAGGQ
jgi:mono/diheme cytochrome c family protein